MPDILKSLTTRSLAANGYVDLPGGLILQWMSVTHTTGQGQNQSYTWPKPFPNAILHVQATDNSNPAAGAVVWSINGEGLAGFNAFWNYSNSTGGTTSRAAFVFAIGR